MSTYSHWNVCTHCTNWFLLQFVASYINVSLHTSQHFLKKMLPPQPPTYTLPTTQCCIPQSELTEKSIVPSSVSVGELLL